MVFMHLGLQYAETQNIQGGSHIPLENVVPGDAQTTVPRVITMTFIHVRQNPPVNRDWPSSVKSHTSLLLTERHAQDEREIMGICG